MPQPPISVVLFDLGGVVCPFDPAPRLTRLAALSNMSEREVQRRIFESGLTADFDRGRYTSTEWHEIVCNELGINVTPDEFEDLMLSILTTDLEVLALVDQVRAHTRVAMLTDNPPLLFEAIPHRFPELLGRFDPMLFSFQLEALKPSAEAFERALARLDAPANKVLFIDDTAVNTEAAAALGMQTHHFTTAAALEAELRARALLDR